jgi:hypothetical protein
MTRETAIVLAQKHCSSVSSARILDVEGAKLVGRPSDLRVISYDVPKGACWIVPFVLREGILGPSHVLIVSAAEGTIHHGHIGE